MLSQSFRTVAAPCMPGAGVCGRGQWHTVYYLWCREHKAQVLQDLRDVWRSGVCVWDNVRAFISRQFVFMSLASSVGKPFWESLFQHQSTRWELLLICGADRASSFSGGVCVGSQWSDERMEYILEEGDHRRTVGIVVRESDLEAKDGVGVRAW